MAYGRNPRVIAKVEPALKLLLSADSEIVIPSKDPTKLAYYLYNAIWLAKELGRKPYDGLEGKWKFKASVRDGKVVCRPKFEALSMIDEIELECPDDSMEVVSKVIKHGLVQTIRFPNISLLTYQEVHSWAELNDMSTSYNKDDKTLSVSRN
jgi:hypothetical protein